MRQCRYGEACMCDANLLLLISKELTGRIYALTFNFIKCRRFCLSDSVPEDELMDLCHHRPPASGFLIAAFDLGVKSEFWRPDYLKGY